MPAPIRSTAAAALSGLWTLALAAFVLTTLHVAQDLLIPLALAFLLTFLLAPLVTRIERWLGRIIAVLLVVALILSATGLGGWVLTRQVVDLAAKLPDYKENIQAKLRALKGATGGRFARFLETVEELKQDLPGGRPPAPAPVPAPATPEAFPLPLPGPTPPRAPPAIAAAPAETNPLQIVQRVIAPILSPIGTAGLVLLLVIFMLLKREDLRRRLIRLIGQGHITATTHAMNEAGTRVARYLIVLLALNVSYGVAVALGLYVIGVPNAILWGVTAAGLRFIPYLGPWIGASIPIALSLAVSPGWVMPILTIALFVSLELVSNNVLEPWLYGSNTGVSPVALIFAAVGWTWLWGPAGLVLATPMTVCLVVLGRHIPRLAFLSVLLGEEEALTPAQDCYHRLLTSGDQDELELIDSYLKAHSLTALYDSVLLPVLAAVETDHRLELLSDEQRDLVNQTLRDVVTDLGTRQPLEPPTPLPNPQPADAPSIEPAPNTSPAPVCEIQCLPAGSDHDRLAAAMFSQLLSHHGVPTTPSSTPNPDGRDNPAPAGKSTPAVVIISIVAPSALRQLHPFCLRLRALQPTPRIVVGFWGATGDVAEPARRARESGADAFVTSFADALAAVGRLTAPPTSSPNDEPRRG